MENAIAIINEDDGKEDVKQFVDLPYDILIDIIYRLPFNEMINLSQSCHKMCSTVLQYIRHKTKSFCIIDFVEKNRLTSIKGFALFIKRCTSPLPEWERIKFLFDLIKNSREWKYIRQQSLHSAICIEQQFDSYETVKLVYNTMILGWPKEHQMEAVNDLAEYMDIGLLTKAFFMKPIGISKEDEVQLTMRVQLITRSMIVDPHCSLMNELIIINEIMFANHPDSIIQILMLFYGPRIICNYVRVRLVQITVEWRSYCTYKLSIAYEQLSKVFLTLYQHCEELNWTKTFVLKLMFELFHFPAPWYATHIADFMSNIGKQLSIDFIRYVIKRKYYYYYYYYLFFFFEFDFIFIYLWIFFP
ncbi:F-box protein 47 [Blomia tropicalis]|nr:F-box protein 47 [Blomia tropicalis]